MNMLTPNLCMVPGAFVVVNSLYDSTDPRLLTQDLVLVELPNQTYIDVSRFPEHDPSGSYTVSVIRAGKQIHEVEAASALEALMAVESLAIFFSQRVCNVSCSEATTTTVDYLRPAA